jgi:hypothetical protein
VQETAKQRFLSIHINNIGLNRNDSKPTSVNIVRATINKLWTVGTGPVSATKKGPVKGGGRPGPNWRELQYNPSCQVATKGGGKWRLVYMPPVSGSNCVLKLKKRKVWRMIPLQRWRGLKQAQLLR